MEHAESYYAASAKKTVKFPKLDHDLQAEIVVIGGGFLGVATALELVEKGHNVVLCEANRIGWGASGRNGGQVTGSLSGDRAMERAFEEMIGEGAQDLVWSLRWRGHDIIRNRVEKYKIDCDLRYGHMQTALTPTHISELKRTYYEACQRGMEADLEWVSKDRIGEYLETDIYLAGIINRKNMHLHPLDLCMGEALALQALGGKIYENTKVLSVDPGRKAIVKTEHGTIFADKVMIAGNSMHRLQQRKMGGKIFPASLGIMATEPISDKEADAINPERLAVYDNRTVLDYYRLTADNRLLFGGGVNYTGAPDWDTAKRLRPAMEKTFPRLKGIKIDYAWSGKDGITMNRIPQVGRVSDNVIYIQGFSGHGIAQSHVMAEIAAHELTRGSDDFALFEDVRHFRLPWGRRIGNQLMALAMFYLRMRDGG